MLHNVDNFKDSPCSIGLNQGSGSPESLFCCIFYKSVKVIFRDISSIFPLLGSCYRQNTVVKLDYASVRNSPKSK